MSEDNQAEKLAQAGRPRFTEAPPLEKIAAMPDEWRPRDHTPLGQEPAIVDPKSKRIADAFDIGDQKQNWLAEAMLTMNDNLFRVMSVAQEALRLAIVANQRQDLEAEKPYRALWNGLKAFALIVVTAVVAVLVDRMLKK